MPSTHVALTVSVAILSRFKVGRDSALFALASVLAIVIMADAAGVRRATGEQAKVLNKIMLIFFKEEKIKNERMQEFIGHTPFEVIVGATIGLVIAIILSIHFYY